jgi:RNA polymerase sigma-70 factor (ECF subfamily)
VKGPTINEKDLLLRITQGDGMAFQIILERYYGMVYSVSMQYLKVHELAEDVVQSTFLKIWENREKLMSVKRFDAYLFIIARNELTDQFRKRANHDKYIKRIGELFEEEENSPLEELIARQRRTHIRDAVAHLPDQQQHIYRLSREKGLSYEEIADETGIAINTVRWHISTALKAIKQFFVNHKNDFYLLFVACFLI